MIACITISRCMRMQLLITWKCTKQWHAYAIWFTVTGCMHMLVHACRHMQTPVACICKHWWHHITRVVCLRRYWMYAAVKAGPKGLLISNDQMRDHLFQLLAPRFFQKWKQRHQVGHLQAMRLSQSNSQVLGVVPCCICLACCLSFVQNGKTCFS